MKTYVSLVKDFINYYVEIELGEDKQFADVSAVRAHMNTFFRPWWCSTYDELPDLPSAFFPEPKVITLFQLEDMIAKSDGLCDYTRLMNEIHAGKWVRVDSAES